MENYEDALNVFLGAINENWKISTSEDEEEDHDAEYIPGQMANLGFDSFDPVQNLGTLGLFTGLYFLKAIFFVFILLPWRLI
mmetsp:Transcript_33041/g.50640  ORF Transcript_33041/g.50640 Transcript_33041/m.50640 type:complete len:82 (+) Transcript_33041:3695-3940(+)